jgi:agmatine deiminase
MIRRSQAPRPATRHDEHMRAKKAEPLDKEDIRVPAEWEPHECCWMAWAVDQRDHWADINKVKDELHQVVQTIAGCEPVRLLTPSDQMADAKARFSGGKVEFVEAPVDDIWMRDIAPTFALCGEGADQEVVAIDWNFNGWGDTADRRARAGDQLAKTAETIFGVPRISTSFVAEGGAVVTDGQGMVITTRSCLLNPNRNPVRRGIDRQQVIEMELTSLAARKVLWLEGDPCEPITSGHVDGYVLLAPNGVVLVEDIDRAGEAPLWRQHDIALLEDARDEHGNEYKIRRVRPPQTYRLKRRSRFFAPCYLNAYVANGSVIGVNFGDQKRDEAAQSALEAAYPGREIVMLAIDHIANDGGGVHCLTQPMPFARRK